MAKTPKIRFEGFTEPWEEKKLEKILINLPFKPYLKNPELGGKYEIIQQGNDAIFGFANGEPCQDFEKTVIFGDHTLSLYKPQRPFFVATDGVRIIQGIDDMEGYYLLALLKKNKPQSEGYKRYYSILADTEVFFTDNHLEQLKIGYYFKNFDTLITLYQRKHDKLVNIKKAMLEKMFPKEGENVPEIRFQGFTEPWERRKLGEIARLNGRIGFRGYTQKDIISKDEGGILTFSPTNIVDNRLVFDVKNTYITQTKYDESPEIKISNGDILFVKTGSTLGKSALVTGLFEPASINPQIVVMRMETTLRRFLSNQLTSEFVQKQVANAKIGGAVPTITEAKIKDFNIFIPIDKKESEALGIFFSSLDTLITLHQRKTDKLKQIKQAMLESMFV